MYKKRKSVRLKKTFKQIYMFFKIKIIFFVHFILNLSTVLTVILTVLKIRWQLILRCRQKKKNKKKISTFSPKNTLTKSHVQDWLPWWKLLPKPPTFQRVFAVMSHPGHCSITPTHSPIVLKPAINAWASVLVMNISHQKFIPIWGCLFRQKLWLLKLLRTMRMHTGRKRGELKV